MKIVQWRADLRVGRRRGGTGPSKHLLAGLLLVIGCAHAEIQIERTFLPDAAPSSFAIGLPGGVNFCFDPVRAAVSYAWAGDYLDLTPARPGPGKFIKAAKPLGAIAYREAGIAPLRRGDPARSPTIEFTGYTLLPNDGIEFRYSVDGVPVREEIRARSDGRGFVRRIRPEGATDAKWWYVVDGQPATELKRAGDALVVEVFFGKGAK